MEDDGLAEYKRLFEKDCPNFDYIPPIIGHKKRIICIGDIHGDMDFAIHCLELAGVIRKNNPNKWTGNDTVVVQVGDQIDSCRPLGKGKECDKPFVTINDKANDIKILEYFTNLHKDAKKDGGMVISLIGNHELMNTAGDMRYVSRQNLLLLDPNKSNVDVGLKNRIEKFKYGSKWAKFMACTRLSTVIIGDFIFVHGGIVDDLIAKKDLNVKNGRNFLLNVNMAVRRILTNQITDKNYLKEIINSDPTSIFWNRTLGSIPKGLNLSTEINRKNGVSEEFANICERSLKNVISTLKIKGMVIGHTPQFFKNKSGINITCSQTKKFHGALRTDCGGSQPGFGHFDQEFLDNAKNIDPVKYTMDSESQENRRPQVFEILYKSNNINEDPTITVLK
jgi:hypothetical protein